ncbi:hypothetical protein OT109_16120 [Phycisphaeraceae bacterium D3-23]
MSSATRHATCTTRRGRSLAVVDRFGGYTFSTYDARGNLIRRLNSAGLETRWAYNEDNLLTHVSDSFISESAYTFDPLADDLDLVWSTASTKLGNGATYVVTEYLYDSLNRSIGTARHANASIQIALDIDPVINSTIAPAGLQIFETQAELSSANTIQTTSTYYDGAGRVVETVGATGLRRGTIFNNAGFAVYTGVLGSSAPAPGSGIEFTLADFESVTEYRYDVWNQDRIILGPGKVAPGTVITLTFNNRHGDLEATVSATAQTPIFPQTTTARQQVMSDLVDAINASVDPLIQQVSAALDADGNIQLTLDADADFLLRADLSNVASPFAASLVYADGATRSNWARDANGHTTLRIMNAQGRVIKTVYHDGSFTESPVDTLGQPIDRADLDTPAAIPASELDGTHRVSTVQRDAADPALATHSLYDGSGNLTDVWLPSVNDPVESSPTYNTLVRPHYAYEYDIRGHVTAITDPNGNRTEFVYDHLGRQTSRTLPEGVLTTADPDDYTESRHFDDTPLDQIIGGLSVSVGAGQLAYEVDFEGRVTAYRYDNTAGGRGRLVGKHYYNTEADYNADAANGELADAARSVSYGYNPFGQLTLANDSGHAITAYAYDDLGRRTQIAVRTQVYIGDINNGALGDDGDSGTAYLMYSAQTTQSRFAGVASGHADHLIAVKFDGTDWLYMDYVTGIGDVWAVFTPEAGDLLVAEITMQPGDDAIASLAGQSFEVEGIEAGYASGDLTFIANQWQGSYNRDEFGIEGTYFTRNGEGQFLNYAYNDLNRITRTWTSKTPAATDAVTDTAYSYDAYGRLETVTAIERADVLVSSGGDTTTYFYDAVGNLDAQTVENGSSTVTTDYIFDALNRLTAMYHFDDADADLAYDAGVETLHASFLYTLDARGNRIASADTVDGETYHYTWVYDALNRLVSEQLDAGDDALDYTDTFVYDLVGNRLSKTRDNASDGSVEITTTYTYDANDRLITEVRDVAGNIRGGDQTTTYTYNGTNLVGKTVASAFGKLHSVTAHTYNEMGRLASTTETRYDPLAKKQVPTGTTVTEYTYNRSGLRVTETTTTDGGTPVVKSFLFDPRNPTGFAQVLEEYIDGVIAKVFTLGHDVVAQADVTDPQQHENVTLLADGHGSTRALLDAVDAIVQQFAYDAYGEMLASTNLATAATALTSILYSGEWTQANGSQYLRARFYDPATGRFNRLDPFIGNRNDPQSLHKYLYAHGNPVAFADPSGHRISFAGVLGGTLRGVRVLSSLARSAVQLFRSALAALPRILAALPGQIARAIPGIAARVPFPTGFWPIIARSSVHIGARQALLKPILTQFIVRSLFGLGKAELLRGFANRELPGIQTELDSLAVTLQATNPQLADRVAGLSREVDAIHQDVGSRHLELIFLNQAGLIAGGISAANSYNQVAGLEGEINSILTEVGVEYGINIQVDTHELSYGTALVTGDVDLAGQIRQINDIVQAHQQGDSQAVSDGVMDLAREMSPYADVTVNGFPIE